MKETIGLQRVSGHARIYRVGAAPGEFGCNLTLAGWALIVNKTMKTLLAGGTPPGFNGIYLEFENVAAPEDRVSSLPSLTTARDVSYYLGLSSHPTRDYLRLPVSTHGSFNSDDEVWAADNGLVVSARSSGLVGMHGKDFSAAANSVVFGTALVSMNDADDPSADWLAAAKYYAEAAQLLKQDVNPIACDWRLTHG